MGTGCRQEKKDVPINSLGPVLEQRDINRFHVYRQCTVRVAAAAAGCCKVCIVFMHDTGRLCVLVCIAPTLSGSYFNQPTTVSGVHRHGSDNERTKDYRQCIPFPAPYCKAERPRAKSKRPSFIHNPDPDPWHGQSHALVHQFTRGAQLGSQLDCKAVFRPWPPLPVLVQYSTVLE